MEEVQSGRLIGNGDRTYSPSIQVGERTPSLHPSFFYRNFSPCFVQMVISSPEINRGLVWLHFLLHKENLCVH